MFFQDPEQNMMVANVGAEGDAFSAGAPEKLFEADESWLTGNITGVFYGVSPDDQRFLVAARVGAESTTPDGAARPPGILVNNFDVELERLVPR